MKLSKISSVALRAAQKAATCMKKFQGSSHLQITEKQEQSLVTHIDLKCENIIVAEIKKQYPHHSIVSEESPPIKTTSPYTWYIDPIDGTHNFIKGNPLYGTSVACAKNGQVITGVIILPQLNETYVAQYGKGAWCNNKKMHVNTSKRLEYATVFFDGSDTSRGTNLAIQKKLKNTPYSARNWGCAVFDFAMVASGKAEGGFMIDTNSWDIAAGALIVCEAGGKVTQTNGSLWKAQDDSIIVSNGLLHRSLKKLVDDVTKK